MKLRGRKYVWLTVTVLLTATVTLIAPVAAANASPLPCQLQEFPTSDGIVSFEGGQLKINPNGAGPYLDDLTDYLLHTVPDYVLCLEGGTVTNTVFCLLSLPTDPARYVYFDENGALTVDVGLLGRDLAPCLLSPA